MNGQGLVPSLLQRCGAVPARQKAGEGEQQGECMAGRVVACHLQRCGAILHGIGRDEWAAGEGGFANRGRPCSGGWCS